MRLNQIRTPETEKKCNEIMKKHWRLSPDSRPSDTEDFRARQKLVTEEMIRLYQPMMDLYTLARSQAVLKGEYHGSF